MMLFPLHVVEQDKYIFNLKYLRKVTFRTVEHKELKRQTNVVVFIRSFNNLEANDK